MNFGGGSSEKVDREKIRDTIESELQEAYSAILEHHGVESGDITPLNLKEIDETEGELVDLVVNWVGRQLDQKSGTGEDEFSSLFSKPVRRTESGFKVTGAQYKQLFREWAVPEDEIPDVADTATVEILEDGYPEIHKNGESQGTIYQELGWRDIHDNFYQFIGECAEFLDVEVEE